VEAEVEPEKTQNLEEMPGEDVEAYEEDNEQRN
jgi:hypothetical protein